MPSSSFADVGKVGFVPGPHTAIFMPGRVVAVGTASAEGKNGEKPGERAAAAGSGWGTWTGGEIEHFLKIGGEAVAGAV